MSSFEAISLAVKALGKPCLMVSYYGDEDMTEIAKAVPWMSRSDIIALLFEGTLLIECATDKERDSYYNRTVGKRGPTRFNLYSGAARVYACALSPSGDVLSENK